MCYCCYYINIISNNCIFRIQDVLPTFKEEFNPPEKAITETDKQAMDKFKELSLADPLKLNFSVKINEYDLVFKKILEERELTFGNDFKDVSFWTFLLNYIFVFASHVF